jgi:hypothetical protein
MLETTQGSQEIRLSHAYRNIRLIRTLLIVFGFAVFILGRFNGKFIGAGIMLYGLLDYTVQSLALTLGARLDRIEKLLADRA